MCRARSAGDCGYRLIVSETLISPAGPAHDHDVPNHLAQHGVDSSSPASPVTRRPGNQTLEVARKDVVADGVVKLRLEEPSGGRLPHWTPGAHIDLVMPTADGGSRCGNTRCAATGGMPPPTRSPCCGSRTPRADRSSFTRIWPSGTCSVSAPRGTISVWLRRADTNSSPAASGSPRS